MLKLSKKRCVRFEDVHTLYISGVWGVLGVEIHIKD